jgi:hypothetical protein
MRFAKHKSYPKRVVLLSLQGDALSSEPPKKHPTFAKAEQFRDRIGRMFSEPFRHLPLKLSFEPAPIQLSRKT